VKRPVGPSACAFGAILSLYIVNCPLSILEGPNFDPSRTFFYPSEQLGAAEASPALTLEVVVGELSGARAPSACRVAKFGYAVEASRADGLADAVVSSFHVDEPHFSAFVECLFEAVDVVVDSCHFR